MGPHFQQGLVGNCQGTLQLNQVSGTGFCLGSVYLIFSECSNTKTLIVFIKCLVTGEMNTETPMFMLWAQTSQYENRKLLYSRFYIYSSYFCYVSLLVQSFSKPSSQWERLSQCQTPQQLQTPDDFKWSTFEFHPLSLRHCRARFCCVIRNKQGRNK